MKFRISVSLALLLFWLTTHVRSPSGWQLLFAPLLLSVLVMSALVRILLRIDGWARHQQWLALC